MAYHLFTTRSLPPQVYNVDFVATSDNGYGTLTKTMQITVVYLTAPIVALSTEMDGLQSSSGDVLAVSSTFSNSQGSIQADIEFIAGGACSPVGDPFLEIWVLRSLDGVSFEDGSATLAPARGPDTIIPVSVGASIRPHSMGATPILLPPGSFKIAVRNQMGIAVPAGSRIRFAELGDASDTGIAGMAGDKTGTTAHRIADLMEKFGVVTYSQSDASVNPWGAGTSDYTSDSVIQALNFLTANSGLRLNVREYHLAGRDTGDGSNQLVWCPTVAAATGAKFDVALARGATTTDVNTLAAMASSSAATSGWMQWMEGLTTPNDGSVTAANCVSVQQALFTAASATDSLSCPVTAVGPSYTYATVPPESAAAVSGYLNASQQANVQAGSSLAAERLFPPSNPGANDSVGRSGYIDDVDLGHELYFGKPRLIAEWHPTQSTGDSPSIATNDSYGAYYAALTLLHAHRLGADAIFWKSLFDIGRSGESPWVRVGLFPNAGNDTPRDPAYTIRAMYALTGDVGSSKRSFVTSKLKYTVSGLPAPPSSATPWMGGHHRLFQDSGGVFYLFVWNERSAPGGSGTDVTITFARAMAQVAHYDLTTTPSSAETPITTSSNVTTLSFSLTASVHLFAIYPQGSVIPTESAQDTTLSSTVGAIYDANGTAWTLVSNPPFGMQVSHGGIIDGQNVVLLLYHDHVVHQQDNVGNWRFWNITTSAWVSEARDPRVNETESSEGLTVNTVGPIIYASQTPGSVGGATLDHFALAVDATVTKNGSPAGSTSNVTELVYHNHTVYHVNTSGNWYYWNGASWTPTTSPFGALESTEGTTVTTVGPIIYASRTPGQPAPQGAQLDTFAINSSAQVVINGVADTNTGAVLSLYYHNHTLYHNASNGNSFGTPGWWTWNGTAWAAVASPSGAAESTDGTSVTTPGGIIYASQTPGQPASGALDEWTFDTSGVVLQNGSPAGYSAGVTQIYYHLHYIFQTAPVQNGLGYNPGWWQWDGATWVDCAPPTPAVKQITIGAISQQIVGQTFGVSGTISAYTTAPNLQYRDNTGTFTALPTGAQVTSSAFSFTHPAFGSASANNTISVRDALDPTVTTTSNNFAVVAAGAMTLTGITLSGNTIIAGAGAGTPIGTIAVQASGGTFSGSLAVNDTTHFRIVPPILQNAAALSAGSYPINLTATMSGATGSPLTRGFTVTASASGNTSVNLSAPTGKTVRKQFFGLSTGSLANVSGDGNTHFNWLTHATLRNSIAQLRPAYLRVNADQQIAKDYANGATRCMDNWFNNYASCFDPGLEFFFGVGPVGNYANAPDSPSDWASYVTQFANAMKNAGHPITRWEIGQENDGTAGDVYASYYVAMCDALHAIDPSYMVGATGASWWGGTDISGFMNNGGDGTSYGVPRVNFFHYHSYASGRSQSDTYQLCTQGRDAAAGDIQNCRQTLAGTNAADVPIYVSEYNVDGNFGDPDPRQGQYPGALYLAAFISGAFRADSNLGGCGVWDVFGDSNYGVIGNAQVSYENESSIDPQGYYLGYAGQHLYGPECTASTSIANMDIIASLPTASSFAIQLLNYDTSANRTVNLTLTGKTPSGPITRWEIGKSSPNTPTIGTQPGLGSITVNSETIVILTGTVS